MEAPTANDIRVQFESQILRGELDDGARLPAVRTLADQLGVSPATVASAYRELRARGLVTGRGRQGTRVAPARRVESMAAPAAPAAPAHLIDAANGSPDPQLLPDLAPALQFAASLNQPTYSAPLIESHLREAAMRLFTGEWRDDAELVVTSGAMDAIERTLDAFDLRFGDRVGVEDPGHVPVHQIVRRRGLQPVPIEVDPEGITPNGLAQALDGGLAALIITPRAQNPTGAALSAERADALTSMLVGRPEVALIQDDHAGLIAGAAYHPIEAPGPQWATTRSLGKALGPDMRLALSVGDRTTMQRVAAGLANGPGWISFILQRAAAHLLGDPDTAALLERAGRDYARRRNRLIARLATAGVEAHAASGLNVWIPTPHVQASIDAARDAGFAIRSGASYQLTNRPAIRVTISLLDDAQIDALADAVADAHSTALRSSAV